MSCVRFGVTAVLAALLAPALLPACQSSSSSGGGEKDTGGDSDTDTDTDVDSDTDSDTDSDGDTDDTQDCSDCEGVGATLDAMLCALDICGADLISANDYDSPTGAETEGTYAAMAHFGDTTNDLAPHENGSYALMATGTATGTAHSEAMGGGEGVDPFSKDDIPIYDVMEWTIELTAPGWAGGFAFDFVFLSEEYDDWIGLIPNDKFYAVIEAQSTFSGAPKVINFAECRDPDEYFDHICQEGELGCEPGEPYCYIAINSALSECCYYEGCPDGTATTDISGTGYTCAGNELEDADDNGSSTGWLTTSWPVDGGETFTLTFHLHDTGDQIYDSEVILDNFRFLEGEVDPST
jgi:hypothetical protein